MIITLAQMISKLIHLTILYTIKLFYLIVLAFSTVFYYFYVACKKIYEISNSFAKNLKIGAKKYASKKN